MIFRLPPGTARIITTRSVSPAACGTHGGGGKYFSASGGLGYVARKTDYLGTHPQFLWRLAFGNRFGNYDLSIAQVHYSNGKKIFGWDGPNRGQDFLTLQLGREF